MPPADQHRFAAEAVRRLVADAVGGCHVNRVFACSGLAVGRRLDVLALPRRRRQSARRRPASSCGRLGERHVPADHQAQPAELGVENRQAVAGSEGQSLLPQMQLAIIAEQLTVGANQDDGIVENALDLLLDRHPKGHVNTASPQPCRQGTRRHGPRCARPGG